MEIQKENSMSISEVASVFNVNEITIRRAGKSLFPEMFRNGIKTYLSEVQVTAIKFHLDKYAELPKTQLEKKILILQAMEFMNEEIAELKQANELMAPKAAIADQSFRNSTQYSIRDAGKDLGIRQSEIFALLREKGLLTTKTLPTQKALDNKLLSIKINVTETGNYNQAVMTAENIMNFKSKYIKES